MCQSLLLISVREELFQIDKLQYDTNPNKAFNFNRLTDRLRRQHVCKVIILYKICFPYINLSEKCMIKLLFQSVSIGMKITISCVSSKGLMDFIWLLLLP